MKKQLLFIASILVGITSTNAQCTITPSCTPDPQTTGYCTTPAQNSNLPNGTVGVAYSTVIQLAVGTSGGGGLATITDVTISNMTLPNGLSYTLNPSNGIIPGGSNACIEITGIPTNAVLDFSCDVSAIANTSIGALPYTLSYRLTIQGATASLTEVVSSELTLFPNPTENILTLNVNEPTDIKIVNVLGTVVLNDRIQSTKTFNLSNFKNGVYFVINESTGASIKLIKK